MKIIFLFALTTIAAEAVKIEDVQRATLAKKYPEHEIAGTCSTKGLGKPGESAVALFDKTGSRFRILWVVAKGEPKELDIVPQSGSKTTFELKCMDPDEAAAHVQALASDSNMHNYVKLPKGASMLCYFTDELSAKCWSTDPKTGALVEIGGWDT